MFIMLDSVEDAQSLVAVLNVFLVSLIFFFCDIEKNWSTKEKWVLGIKCLNATGGLPPLLFTCRLHLCARTLCCWCFHPAGRSVKVKEVRDWDERTVPLLCCPFLSFLLSAFFCESSAGSLYLQFLNSHAGFRVRGCCSQFCDLVITLSLKSSSKPNLRWRPNTSDAFE